MIDTIIAEEKNGLLKLAGLSGGDLREVVIYDSAKANEGDIYLGKITNKITTANGHHSYLVNIGDMDVFINAAEDGLEDLEAHEGQDIILQIAQEARAEKKARGVRFLQFAGINLVYCPYGEGVDISGRIRDDNKVAEIKDWLNEVREDEGWIVRTHAQEADKDDIVSEAKALKELFNEVMTKAKSVKSPAVLWKKNTSLQDMVSINEKTLQKIVVNNHLLEDKFSAFEVAFTREPWGEYGIDEQVANAMQCEVKLLSGGRLFIEETKAVVAIDVDSAGYGEQGGISRLNNEAAKEIAKQISLRNLSGKIIIDFAGLTEYHFLKEAVDILERELRADAIKARVLGVSKAGNVEVLRARRRPSLRDVLTIECEICHGCGRVEK